MENRCPAIFLAVAALMLIGGLFLGGCDSEDARAQIAGATRIETFSINPGSFALFSDLEPTVEIADGTTRYTLASRATLTFTISGGEVQNLTLQANEVVIERPAAQTVTVIRAN